MRNILGTTLAVVLFVGAQVLFFFVMQETPGICNAIGYLACPP
jgi:hypothetical protein